jgi:polyphosphate kinase 2 (PPK2 family)
MNIQTKGFRVEKGTTVDLSKWPTGVKAFYTSKKQDKKRLKEHKKALSDLQRIHYASNHYALLLIFQAMDAAGKDGAIRHIMSGVNPQGCQVFSFKHPSATELDHDFCGAPHNRCLNAAASVFSIVPIMRKSSSFECIQRFC